MWTAVAGYVRQLPEKQSHGPGFWKVDVAVARLFPLGAGQNIEVRAKVFNLTNNFNWGSPQTNLSSGAFGRITTL